MNREERMMMYRRNVPWLVLALVFALLSAARPVGGQTASIPLSELPPAPTSGTLANGVEFEVDVGRWRPFSPPPGSPRPHWAFSVTTGPSTWTFDQPVELRFSITNLQFAPNEAVQLPPGTVAESISPAHIWNASTRVIRRNPNNPDAAAQSVFTHPGTNELRMIPIGPDGTPGAARGPAFIQVTIIPEPGIAIDKSGTGPDPLEAGDTVDYSFVVTNTGNVTLSNVTITDPLPEMSAIDCPGDTLSPGAEMTCSSTYTVTQEDADTGFVENTATVTGVPPSGPAVSAEDGAVVPPSQKPGIAVEKSASGPEPLEVGATIDYSFVVTNIGNVSLSNVTVTDPLPGLSPIDCPETTLAPGAETTCTATYAVTQEDVDAGVIENTATATGQPPGDLPPPSDQGTTTFPPDQNPGISIEKSGSGPDPLEVGASIDYTFVVTNTGNITLNNVTVTDPLPGLSPISCPGDILAPGAEMTCTATYTVTQQDVDAGAVENTATVAGEPPTGGPPPTDESTTTVPPTATSGIAIEKSGSGPDPLTVGATIDYTFLVTNTGNVTLTNVVVTDPLPGLSPIDCPGTVLPPGSDMTCAATYEVTQADVDAGVVENTATVTGETPTGGPPPTDESTTTVPPAEPVPALPPLAFVLLVALLATATLWTLRRARA